MKMSYGTAGPQIPVLPCPANTQHPTSVSRPRAPSSPAGTRRRRSDATALRVLGQLPLPPPQRLPRRPLHRGPWLSRPTRPHHRRLRVSDPGRIEDGLPAGLPVAREPEVVLLARHAGHDPAQTGPAAEVLPDAGNHWRFAAGRVAE